MISCSAVTQKKTWLFILSSLEAQTGTMPFCTSFALHCFPELTTCNRQFVLRILLLHTTGLMAYFGNSSGDYSGTLVCLCLLTQRQSHNTHLWWYASVLHIDVVIVKVHLQPDKGHLVRLKSKREFRHSHTNAVLEAVRPNCATALISMFSVSIIFIAGHGPSICDTQLWVTVKDLV